MTIDRGVDADGTGASTVPQQIGPYQIVGLLGAGGCGEVYRARDTKLGRDVAIKILSRVLVPDGDRVARIEREARLLAALNHPAIATIHGIEAFQGKPALILELVEGPTLAERLARGPLPERETSVVAGQIAEALDAAHQKGIVHRDLKPANIKFTPQGFVKVLDFGLATLLAPAAAEGHELSGAPTLMATDGGGRSIAGTPPYMSPEQVRGEVVDRTADNWAFGCVLVEMLTGRPLFARKTMADTFAAVLHEEPDWSQVPTRMRRLARSCLQKDSRQRLRDIADARLLIDDVDEAAPAKAPRKRLGWAAAALLALMAAAALWVAWPAEPPEAAPVRFHILSSAVLPASGASAISPDGRHLAFLGTGTDGNLRVWVRDMEGLADRPLPGSEVTPAAPPPFWSPDSRFIAFDAGGKLKKIDISGGLAQTICDLRSLAVGGSWNRRGVIIFASLDQGIMRVPEAGGTPVPVTTVDPSKKESFHLTPVFLPDGRRFIYLRVSRSAPERTGIFVGSIDAKPEAQDPRRVLSTSTSVAYVPRRDGSGTILFLRDGNLMAQTFDEGLAAMSGSPTLVAERVDSYRDGATMSASENGVLVYREAASLQLTWYDRQGRVVGRVREQGLYQSVALSPDGAHAVVSKAGPQVTGTKELWLLDFARETSARFASPASDGAVWSPDGSRVVFGAEGGLYQRVALGTPHLEELQPATEPSGRGIPTSWSPDGRFIMYSAFDPTTGRDVWTLSLAKARTATPFLRSGAAESEGQFSPRAGSPVWVAYTSNESGRDEVFVQTFPEGAGRQLVSRGGGHSPKWRGDGRELFYVSADGAIIAAAFTDRGELGPPTTLFEAPPGLSRDATGAPWAVSPDGQRFLLAVPVETGMSTRFTVVLNWQADSRRAP